MVSHCANLRVKVLIKVVASCILIQARELQFFFR